MELLPFAADAGAVANGLAPKTGVDSLRWVRPTNSNPALVAWAPSGLPGHGLRRAIGHCRARHRAFRRR